MFRHYLLARAKFKIHNVVRTAIREHYTVNLTPEAVRFFRQKEFAVVGASVERSKYGNKVFRCYDMNGYTVYPINKKDQKIEGYQSVGSLTSLCQQGKIPFDIGVSIITPPAVTRCVLEEGYLLGFRYFYLQPGTYDDSVDAFVGSAMKDATVVKGSVLLDLGYY
jgi:predicted CoA-binding protein